MLKSKKLTQKQQQLITENFKEIEKRLKAKFGYTRIQYINGKYSYDELLSFLPEIAMVFDEQDLDPKDFVRYAVKLVYIKFIDRCRKVYKRERGTIQRRSKVLKISEDLRRKCGYVSQIDLENELIKLGLKSKSYLKAYATVCFDIDSPSAAKYGQQSHKPFEEVDWDDTKDTMATKADQYFDGPNLEIYKSILFDYLVPKCEDKRHKTLAEIAKDFGKTEGRICQMLHDDKMKRFASQICQ